MAYSTAQSEIWFLRSQGLLVLLAEERGDLQHASVAIIALKSYNIILDLVNRTGSPPLPFKLEIIVGTKSHRYDDWSN